MDEEKLERAILEYLSKEDDELEIFRSLTTIFKKFARPYALRNSSFFDESHEILEDKEFVKSILDQMVADGLLEARIGERDYEPSYRPTDLGVYERSFEDFSLVVEPSGVDDTIRGESSSWTGLPKTGVLTEASAESLRVALRLVDQAVQQSSATNEERAQARAYVIALQALADAPAPPADLIWKIIMLAAAIAGIGSLFVGLADLYK